MPSLERLPITILETICDFLLQAPDDRRSLFAFSLSSRTCCDATTKARFQRVCLISELATYDFHESLSRAEEFLDGRFGLVRYLEVAGERESPLSAEYQRDHHGGLFTRHGRSYDHDGRYLPTERAEDLGSLVDFIKRLPGIFDLVWFIPNQVPNGLVDILERDIPRCRLHIRNFHLPSLGFEVTGPHGDWSPPKGVGYVTKEEYALANSSQLHSVAISELSPVSEQRWDYSREAILQMVTSHSSALRQVRLNLTFDGGLMAESHRDRFLPHWSGLQLSQARVKSQDCAAATKGCLESLALTGHHPVTEYQLRIWDDSTDFSVLTELELSSVGSEAAAWLLQMAQQCRFKSLDNLSLGLFTYEVAGSHVPETGVGAFVSALEPLRCIKIRHVTTQALRNTIWQAHGSAIRELSLDGRRLSLDDVQRLAQSCSQLRKLYIPVHRTMGDKHEVAIYRALGEMAHLESASLILDCDRERVGDVFESGAYLNPSLPEQATLLLRDCLIDAAVDAALAVSVFDVIAKSQADARSRTDLFPQEPSLLRLQLKVRGAGLYSHEGQTCPDLRSIFNYLTPIWVCRRSASGPGHQGNGIIAEEKNEEDREILLRELDGLRLGEMDDQGVFDSAWRMLWDYEDDNWAESWKGAPLDLD